ncbi:MAG: CvpA family protein [Chloroflexota bacterium]|nr:CvpA family protein [Chloroflexota bacterium]
MIVHQAPQKRRSTQDLTMPLVISVLGIAGIIILKSLIPSLQPIEMALLFVAVVFGAIGYTQNIIRGFMSVVMLYIATGVAATFYITTAPFVGAPFGDEVNRNILALSFGVLTAAIWITLGVLSRTSFRDTNLPALGILDNLGGMFIYLIIGVLVASLLFNSIGYGQLGRRAHDKAFLRPRFNQVLNMYYTTQSFWFPKRPPPIYAYDLDLSRGR